LSLSDKIYLIAGLGAFAWAFYAEMRIRSLSTQLAVSKDKDADQKIVNDVDALSEADLKREAAEFISRTEPPAGTKS
jgi:hypothetical protein